MTTQSSQRSSEDWVTVPVVPPRIGASCVLGSWAAGRWRGRVRRLPGRASAGRPVTPRMRVDRLVVLKREGHFLLAGRVLVVISVNLFGPAPGGSGLFFWATLSIARAVGKLLHTMEEYEDDLREGDCVPRSVSSTTGTAALPSTRPASVSKRRPGRSGCGGLRRAREPGTACARSRQSSRHRGW
jgi:hypothetical protein